MKKNHLRIRGGSGLGDAVYLRPIADHFVRKGFDVFVLSLHQDVFIGSGATALMFDKNMSHVVAHYAHARTRQTTNQFEDMLESARIIEKVAMRFSWPVRNRDLVKTIRSRAAGRKVIVVHGGRPPFGRTDGMGIEILPERWGFESAFAHLNGEHFTVRIGSGICNYSLPCNLDMYDKTTVSDVLDIVSTCDGVITQCGFPIPMAECFDKPVLGVWSSRGLSSKQAIVPTVTPNKILTSTKSSYIVDDWDRETIRGRMDGFCQLV